MSKPRKLSERDLENIEINRRRIYRSKDAWNATHWPDLLRLARQGLKLDRAIESIKKKEIITWERP